ncbi:MAG TPA: ACT domain-containing protein [Bryobacteraceae bacterium]|nr:ACT domain-containing protein [Bryobacteraceae bacterium]
MPSESGMTTVGNPPSNRPATLEAIRQEFEESGQSAGVLKRRSEIVDGQVLQAYDEHLASTFPTGLAVLAVGGFGRSELFPYSDVDLCLLVESDKLPAAERAAISSFLQTLWDAGLRISHSVRTGNECCEVHDRNVELNVSLLDQRLLAGDHGLYETLQPRLRKFIDSQCLPLARHVCRLARQRHTQFHETIYHLEPNIKEGPGGLRDLHLLDWFRKLQAPGMTEIASPEELDPARQFIYTLRCYLHYRSKRDNNVLNFDAQEDLSEQRYSAFADAKAWMREYFRQVRLVHGAATRAMEAVEAKNNTLLAGFREWRSRLSNADFTVSRDRIYFKAPHAMEKDPELVLRLFTFVARHGIKLSLEAERRVVEAYPTLQQYFSEPRPLWPTIRELLSLPHAAMGLRAMQDAGVLRLLFPEWKTIECCVVRDFYHRYTVDEHTIVTIENLQALARSTEPGHRRFATMLSEIEDLAVLRFALLFHDVGKGLRTGNHSEESVKLAGTAMARIQTPEKHARMVTFLVDQHLALSAAMTARDLDDPATARALAAKVGTLEGLRYLTLLTYADIAAVNPTALSPWRLEQLWRVYLTAQHELTLELQTDRIAAVDAPPDRASFLKGLPVRYLRTHTEEEIRLHLELEHRRRDAEIALDIRKTEGGYMLTVLAKDRLSLFASVAGALASFGMNILKAEAFANQQGTILDTFIFEDPARTLDLNPPELDRLLLNLERVMLGRIQVKELLRNRPKPSLPGKRSGFPPRVSFDNSASDSATLIEIVAEDRPGLLYDIAAVLSNTGCNIELVLVDTEAHKAMDVFYVSTQGKKLVDTAMPKLQESLEQACRGGA